MSVCHMCGKHRSKFKPGYTCRGEPVDVCYPCYYADMNELERKLKYVYFVKDKWPAEERVKKYRALEYM
jgi:hypothetical protein